MTVDAAEESYVREIGKFQTGLAALMLSVSGRRESQRRYRGTKCRSELAEFDANSDKRLWQCFLNMSTAEQTISRLINEISDSSTIRNIPFRFFEIMARFVTAACL